VLRVVTLAVVERLRPARNGFKQHQTIFYRTTVMTSSTMQARWDFNGRYNLDNSKCLRPLGEADAPNG
jgi:hypothetical protein